MKAFGSALVAMLVSASLAVHSAHLAPAPGERGRMLDTELDRCFLGQPERFSEPP